MAPTQQSLEEYTTGTSTATITRTVVLELATSQRKTQLVREATDEFQTVLEYMADRLPSYPEHEWTGRHTTMYRQATRAIPEDERTIKATIVRSAQQRVAEAFASWRERGKPGNRPRFDGEDYLGLSHQDVEVVEHGEGDGWGLKASFIPYNSVWFPIRDDPYQREYLERITDEEDDASGGSAELHIDDDGNLRCHLTVSWDVEVYESADLETTVGVDLNDDPLVAAVATDASGEVLEDGVELVRGREYRHHRERLKQKRREASERGDLRTIKSARLTYDRYTDHITNVASRRVVDLAERHAPAVIRLEDLAHYRETAKDPIHDWPFDEIQWKIAYKAREAGLPVEIVSARGTSITCRRCGTTDPDARDDREFHCSSCGYQVHADINAAINIAEREPGD